MKADSEGTCCSANLLVENSGIGEFGQINFSGAGIVEEWYPKD